MEGSRAGDGDALALSSPSAGPTPLEAAARIVLEQHYRVTTRYGHARAAFAELCLLFPAAHLETLTKDMLRAWIAHMRRKGNKPSTINCKLSVVGVMFGYFDIKGREVPFVAQPAVPMWWMTPETEKRAIAWCRANDADALANYIRWTVLTGLRVEETLRVQRQHFTGLGTAHPSLTVPGTKTRAAQAAIPLLPEAVDIAVRLLGSEGAATDRIFPMRYDKLQRGWKECRKALGLEGVHGATLKALRRSFARIATERGVPPDMLRQYMRHELLATTAGYLRLVGGYGTEQMRQWFR
jgi:integrase